MKVNTNPIGAALKRNRLNQTDVAAAIGLSRMTVHVWCNGHALPSGPNLVKLTKYLQQFEPGITERQLLPFPGVMPDPVSPTPGSGETA